MPNDNQNKGANTPAAEKAQEEAKPREEKKADAAEFSDPKDPANAPYHNRMKELQRKRTEGNMRADEQEELLSLEKKFNVVGEYDNPGALEPKAGGEQKETV